MADMDVAAECMPDAPAEARTAVRRGMVKLLELTYPEIPGEKSVFFRTSHCA